MDAALYRAGLEQERAREAQESLPAAVHRETGQAMEAPGIESSGGPEGMRLRLPDGGTAGLSELEFARPETRTLYRMAESYPTEKARSYVGLYDGETPLRAYTEAFQRMYEAGERGSGYTYRHKNWLCLESQSPCLILPGTSSKVWEIA